MPKANRSYEYITYFSSFTAPLGIWVMVNIQYSIQYSTYTMSFYIVLRTGRVAPVCAVPVWVYAHHTEKVSYVYLFLAVTHNPLTLQNQVICRIMEHIQE